MGGRLTEISAERAFQAAETASAKDLRVFKVSVAGIGGLVQGAAEVTRPLDRQTIGECFCGTAESRQTVAVFLSTFTDKHQGTAQPGWAGAGTLMCSEQLI